MTATSSSATTQAPPDAVALTGVRARADVALRVLGMVTMAAIVIQFALAGLGAFGGSFAAHSMLGYVIALLALLVAVAALVARPNKAAVPVSVLLVVLALVVQPLLGRLGWSAAWVGSLHALNAAIIAGITGSLMGGAIQRAKARRPTR